MTVSYSTLNKFRINCDINHVFHDMYIDIYVYYIEYTQDKI